MDVTQVHHIWDQDEPYKKFINLAKTRL